MILLEGFFGIPYAEAILIIVNLIVIESLLSVDNAAVLASMVMKLPESQRGKALRYGIIGAYVFRGLCLLAAGYLIKLSWLKLVGGVYLLYLAVSHFAKKKTEVEIGQEEADITQKSKLYQLTIGKIGLFWGTVISIELMDLAFSIDNVLAAVAYVEDKPHPAQLYLLWIGVFIGILAMRFVAQGFVKLMEKFPSLETAAFVVIGVLGIKLVFDGVLHYLPETNPLKMIMDDEHMKHTIDLWFSIGTIVIFLLPIVWGLLFKKKTT